MEISYRLKSPKAGKYFMLLSITNSLLTCPNRKKKKSEFTYRKLENKMKLTQCPASFPFVRKGLKFVSSPPHVYTTKLMGSLIDIDGPRCWFPCLDQVGEGGYFTLELTCKVPEGFTVISMRDPIGKDEEDGAVRISKGDG